jgi:glycosyltransferase involved in cell wall biosynthesis
MPGSPTSPITFPWTVSLTDPLLLYVVAIAEFCACKWSAEIPWVSGWTCRPASRIGERSSSSTSWPTEPGAGRNGVASCRRADVVVQKSRQEGFGLIVTEAMLQGKAVVAARVGGIPLQLKDGRNGVTLPSRAGDDQWAAALGQLVDDDAERLRLWEQARADVLERRIVDGQLNALIRGLTPLLA